MNKLRYQKGTFLERLKKTTRKVTGGAQCNIVERKQVFGATLYYRLHEIILKIEATTFSEILVRSYNNTECYLPEGVEALMEFITNFYTLPSISFKTKDYYVTHGMELYSYYLLVI